MTKIVKLKKGFDLKLVGKAPLEFLQVVAATTFAINPRIFREFSAQKYLLMREIL